jgi:hypothetical protein
VNRLSYPDFATATAQSITSSGLLPISTANSCQKTRQKKTGGGGGGGQQRGEGESARGSCAVARLADNYRARGIFKTREGCEAEGNLLNLNARGADTGARSQWRIGRLRGLLGRKLFRRDAIPRFEIEAQALYRKVYQGQAALCYLLSISGTSRECVGSRGLSAFATPTPQSFAKLRR